MTQNRAGRVDARCGPRDIARGKEVVGSNRVNRGGDWNNNANNATVANRNNNTPDNANNNIGFRLSSSRRPPKKEAAARWPPFTDGGSVPQVLTILPPGLRGKCRRRRKTARLAVGSPARGGPSPVVGIWFPEQ